MSKLYRAESVYRPFGASGLGLSFDFLGSGELPQLIGFGRTQPASFTSSSLATKSFSTCCPRGSRTCKGLSLQVSGRA